jgi:hypothetical protein
MNGANTRAIACGGDPEGKIIAGEMERKRLIVERFEEIAARKLGFDCVLGALDPGGPLTARNVAEDPGDRFVGRGGGGGGGACVCV